jgi:hypothetical protein
LKIHGISGSALEHLTSLSSTLHELSIRDASLTDFSAISALTQLRLLDVWGSGVNGHISFSSLTKLKSVGLGNAHSLKNEHFVQLAAATRLESLMLDDVPSVTSSALADTLGLLQNLSSFFVR